jgi:hypothetical protein
LKGIVQQSPYRIIRDISQHNREDSITSQQKAFLNERISAIKAGASPKELLMLIKLLAEFIFFDSMGYFIDVLRTLRSQVPEIENYLYEDPYGEPLDGPMLRPLAVQTLIQFFEDKFKYPPGVLSCQPLSSLSGLVEEMIRSGEDGGCRGWTVWNDLQTYDPHIVPVFAFRAKGKVNLFIFDSVGHTLRGSPEEHSISASLRCLIDRFKDTQQIADHIIVHSYKEQRQMASSGCSIFSLLDLKNLLERHLHKHESLSEFYQGQSGDFEPRLITEQLGAGELPVYELNILPPEMMKVTQSLSQINRYRMSPMHWESNLATSSPRCSFSGDMVEEIQDVCTMGDKVSNCTSFSPSEKSQNLYVEKKRLTFLISSILSKKNIG